MLDKSKFILLVFAMVLVYSEIKEIRSGEPISDKTEVLGLIK